MKKHELLEKAMRDYPAGTIAAFKNVPDVRHISDGKFKITESHPGNYIIESHSAGNCFYVSYGEEWAEVVSMPSIAVRPDFIPGDKVIIAETEAGCHGALHRLGIVMEHSSPITSGLPKSDKPDYIIKIGKSYWGVNGKLEKAPKETIIYKTFGYTFSVSESGLKIAKSNGGIFSLPGEIIEEIKNTYDFYQ